MAGGSSSNSVLEEEATTVNLFPGLDGDRSGSAVAGHDEQSWCGAERTGKDHSTWGGGHRRCTVTVESLCTVSRACERPVWPVKRRLRLTRGPPAPFHNFNDFNHPNFEIRIGNLPDVKKSLNFAGRHFET
jgi:hypothetical protein